MTAVLLQIRNRTISGEEIVPRLASYQMLPQLYRESIIDEAIAPIDCTAEEIVNASQQFYEQNQLIDETTQQLWLKKHGMSREFLEIVFIPRLLKIEKFKHQTWYHKLESYFLQRKRSLDRAIYSLIRVKDQKLRENCIFGFKKKSNHLPNWRASIPKARSSSQWNLCPAELGTIHPNLAHLLAISRPGQLWHPIPVEGWLAIVRLETLIPAQFDLAMRQRLLRELFEIWVQEQIGEMLN